MFFVKQDQSNSQDNAMAHGMECMVIFVSMAQLPYLKEILYNKVNLNFSQWD